MGLFATSDGTKKYAARFIGRAAAGHFREQQGLWLSSIGIGTYLGEPNDATDRAYTEAISTAVRSGVNVKDLTFGVGLRYKQVGVDYAAQLHRFFAADDQQFPDDTNLDATHLVSASFSW